MTNREDYSFILGLAEKAERHEDMLKFIKLLSLCHIELNIEEWNLFSFAVKNSIRSKKFTWLKINSDQRGINEHIVKMYCSEVNVLLQGSSFLKVFL